MTKKILTFILWSSSFFCSFAIVKLNQPLAANGKVQTAIFAKGINSDFIVYTADTKGFGQFNLFSVNALTRAVTNLDNGLAPSGNVLEYKISPDGQFVVFRADKDLEEIFELFSAPVKGGPPIKLHPNLISLDQDVSEFQISPDSQKVVYLATIDNPTTNDLYVSSINQNNATNLTSGLFGAISFGIAPSSSNIVFIAQAFPNSFTEIFNVPVNGGPITQLNPPYIVGQNVFDFKIFPKSDRIIYRAFQDDLSKPDLYQVNLDGSNTNQITEPAPNGGLVASNYEITANESNLIYITSQVQPDLFNILSYSFASNTRIVLNSPLPPQGDVNSFKISSDDNSVVYRANQNTENQLEIFHVPVSGGTVTLLNGPIKSFVFPFEITPNSTRVIYIADANTTNLQEIFTVPLTGGLPVKLNPNLVDGGDVESFLIDGKQRQVFYLADQNTDNQLELFVAPDDGSSIATQINSQLVKGGNVISYAINPQNTRLFYLADQETEGKIELYSRVIAKPIITSPNNATGTVSEPFQYTITAQNPPFTGFQVQNLPPWATLQSNQITGIPTKLLLTNLVIFVTNEVGVSSTNLTLKINPKILPPDTNIIEQAIFTGDFNGDNLPDLLAQKKQTVTLISFLSNGTFSAGKTLELPSKKDKVVAANLIQGTNALIVRNGATLSAIQVDTNFTTLATINLGSLPDKKTKVRASGDINQDGAADILTQKGKNLGAFLSPGYSFFPFGTTEKRLPPIVAIMSKSDTTNTPQTLLLASGKKLFTYDLLTTSPFLNPTNTSLTTGPILDQKYKVAGAFPNLSNTNASQIFLQKGNKAGVITYGATTLSEPILETKTLGKIVGPK